MSKQPPPSDDLLIAEFPPSAWRFRFVLGSLPLALMAARYLWGWISPRSAIDARTAAVGFGMLGILAVVCWRVGLQQMRQRVIVNRITGTVEFRNFPLSGTLRPIPHLQCQPQDILSVWVLPARLGYFMRIKTVYGVVLVHSDIQPEGVLLQTLREIVEEVQPKAVDGDR